MEIERRWLMPLILTSYLIDWAVGVIRLMQGKSILNAAIVAILLLGLISLLSYRSARERASRTRSEPSRSERLRKEPKAV